MITRDDAFALVHQRLYDGLPEGTVLNLWNIGSQMQDVDLTIAEGDRTRLAAALEIPYDGTDESPLKTTLEQRAVALWSTIEAEQGPLVSEDEYQQIRHAWTSALQLFTEEDVNVLASGVNEIGEGKGGDYTGWADNGGDPDGPTWLLWPCDSTLLTAAQRAGVAHKQSEGFELEYPLALNKAFQDDKPPFPLRGPWSGVGCLETMLVVDEGDAIDIVRWLTWQAELEEVASE